MRCVIFGFGYMGKIRYQILRDRSEVTDILIVDPGLDMTTTKIDGKILPFGAAIPWETIDAAFICTPNNVTASLCANALFQCGNVFCEKPPGRNWDDFRKIADAAVRVPDHRLVFGFNHRLHP